MANEVKEAIRGRKQKLQNRKTELKASRVLINDELDGVEAGIAYCDRLLSDPDQLNPYDICPELYNQELEPQT